MSSNADKSSARDAILSSIRTHLAASAPFDARERAIHHDDSRSLPVIVTPDFIHQVPTTLVELFKQSLEAVDGNCVVVGNENELSQAIDSIIESIHASKIAISDSAEIGRLVKSGCEVSVAPSASEIFSYHVGVSGVQAAIAETGTLVLDSSRERHRLLSLVPPVHIAVVKASQIFETLGEALAFIQRDQEVSPIVTFVTGPSRTADIELTLAIGVHGPQELFVVVHDDVSTTTR